jgi:hypothetical protein
MGKKEREDEPTKDFKRAEKAVVTAAHHARQLRMNASRSALIVGASVVGIPCGNPLYVFNVPFFSNFAARSLSE